MISSNNSTSFEKMYSKILINRDQGIDLSQRSVNLSLGRFISLAHFERGCTGFGTEERPFEEIGSAPVTNTPTPYDYWYLKLYHISGDGVMFRIISSEKGYCFPAGRFSQARGMTSINGNK